MFERFLDTERLWGKLQSFTQAAINFAIPIAIKLGQFGGMLMGIRALYFISQLAKPHCTPTHPSELHVLSEACSQTAKAMTPPSYHAMYKPGGGGDVIMTTYGMRPLELRDLSMKELEQLRLYQQLNPDSSHDQRMMWIAQLRNPELLDRVLIQAQQLPCTLIKSAGYAVETAAVVHDAGKSFVEKMVQCGSALLGRS
jgi:hypothetical protein